MVACCAFFLFYNDFGFRNWVWLFVGVEALARQRDLVCVVRRNVVVNFAFLHCCYAFLSEKY